MISIRMVGVNEPESGIGKGVADEVAVDTGVAVIFGFADEVGVADGVVLGVAVGVVVGVADGVASKPGPSAASTTNVLVIEFSTPDTSRQVTVILCVPGSRLSGGFQVQLPSDAVVTVSVTGSDSRVIVSSIAGGALPKNSGLVEVMVSSWFMLSSVTSLSGSRSPSVIKNLDD